MDAPVDLYQRAIKLWGPVAQLDLCIEECAELTVALSHVKRGRVDPKSPKLAEEIADVSILLDQLEVLLNNHELVSTARRQKLARLQQRVEYGEAQRENDPSTRSS